MKKIIWIALLLFFIVLSACSENSSNTETANDSSSSEASGEETYELKMNVAFPPSVLDWEPKVSSTDEFAKLVEEKTDGRVTVEIFFNNQLAGQSESLDALAKGTIDLQNTTPTAWADKIPESSFSVLPFWNKGAGHTMHMLRETELGDLYEEALEEYGIKPLFYWASDETGFLSNSPIQSPADLNGLIVNNSSSITADYYESMNAGVANVPFIELYEGLLRGTVDAISAPFSGLDTYKFHEVADYLNVPGTINPMFGVVAINMEQWNEFPTDIQEAINEAAQEVETKALDASKKLSEYAFEFAEENEIEVVEMTDEGLKEFTERAQEMVWPKFAAINDRAGRMVEIIKEENEKWEQENAEE